MDVRGLTLRSKSRRPQISAPKPITDPNSGASKAAPGPPAPTLRPQRNGGATSDLVKRRYSAKFNQLPDFAVGEAPPIPSLPGNNIQSAKSSFDQTRPSTSSSSQPPRVEPKALKDPSLQVDNYVANLLANASEQEIREYQNGLRKLKNRTSTDLQQNVYQNRTQFIKISKEAEKLKEEMTTLRGLMSELTTALGQASATNGSNSSFEDSAAARRHANRSSVANLESMWNVQLQTLWKTVERSQKFLPAIPGRHIVLESGQWVELDSATWKPRRPVHIVLLNDHLLVAAKKRKRMDPNTQNNSKTPAPTKLVAEECWPLQDIDLIDLGDGDEVEGLEDVAVSNAVNIRYGPKSFTYRTDQRSSKSKHDLILTFRKTLEDLRKGMRTEAEAAAKSNELKGGRQSLSRRSELFSDSETRDKLDILIDVDGKQQNMKWVDSQLDDLDINIALQQSEDAVARVEKLRKLTKTLRGNLVAQDLINSNVDIRAEKLAEIILRALVDTHSFLNATKLNVSWLTRLGFDDSAREAYLRARTDVMTKRARHCVFEGDLPLYIFQLSFIYFTMIKNTIGIYQQCFPSNMTSACIKWAKEHLDVFNATLSRQLSTVSPENQIWGKCIQIVLAHAAVLGDVGVDFRNLVQLDMINQNGHSINYGPEAHVGR